MEEGNISDGSVGRGGGGVAIAEINQPWLANIGILSHLGYFHKVVDDYLIVLSIN